MAGKTLDKVCGVGVQILVVLGFGARYVCEDRRKGRRILSNAGLLPWRGKGIGRAARSRRGGLGPDNDSYWRFEIEEFRSEAVVARIPRGAVERREANVVQEYRWGVGTPGRTTSYRETNRTGHNPFIISTETYGGTS